VKGAYLKMRVKHHIVISDIFGVEEKTMPPPLVRGHCLKPPTRRVKSLLTQGSSLIRNGVVKQTLMTQGRFKPPTRRIIADDLVFHQQNKLYNNKSTNVNKRIAIVFYIC